MGTQAGVGMSHHRNTRQAAEEAVQMALKIAQITQPDFVFVFSSLGYDQQLLIDTVRRSTGNCPLSGCSGQGIITQGEADESGFSVAVMVIQSDELSFETHLETHLETGQTPESDSDYHSFYTMGQRTAQYFLPHLMTQAAQNLQAVPNQPTEMTKDSIALFLFTDGLNLNFDQLAAGLQSELPIDCQLPFLGGASGSDIEMRATYQYCNNRVVENGLVATLISGRGMKLAWTVNHGCVPVGYPMTVTRAEGNVIYELDHKPVFDVLRQFLSEDEIKAWDRTIVSFCFGIEVADPQRVAPLEWMTELVDPETIAIRYLPKKDPIAGSVTLQTEIKTGCRIWVARRDSEKIIQSNEASIRQLQAKLVGNIPKLIFQFDCYGRGRSVFVEAEKLRIQRHLQQAIGENVPWIGLYTHGEIAPIRSQNTFHNYTLVLTALY
jgi:hypothetical protein